MEISPLCSSEIRLVRISDISELFSKKLSSGHFEQFLGCTINSCFNLGIHIYALKIFFLFKCTYMYAPQYRQNFKYKMFTFKVLKHSTKYPSRFWSLLRSRRILCYFYGLTAVCLGQFRTHFLNFEHFRRKGTVQLELRTTNLIK